MMNRRLINLMTLCVVLTGFLLALAIAAQEASVPVLSDKSRADMRDIQLRLVQTQSEANQLQTRMSQLQDQFFKDNEALKKLKTEACKELKLDCEKDWTLDMNTLKFTKNPAPPATPAPEKPKP